MRSVALLSNVTTGILQTELSFHFQVYVPDGFDTWRLEMHNEGSVLYRTDFDMELYLFYGDSWRNAWNTLEDGIYFIRDIEADFRTYFDYKNKCNAVISTIDFPAVQIVDISEKKNMTLEWQSEWNHMLLRLQSDYKNIQIYNWDKSIHKMGTDRFYSPKMWYTGSMPFSLKGIQQISRDMDVFMRGILKERKKCIVLDLDNTLWGGVAGEGDIVIDDHNDGKIFQDFQKQLKQVKGQGIILTILSKNNLSDVEDILQKHPQMALRLPDFAAYKIDWEEKHKNIRSLAEELNIGLDSMVFIDDNPAEREAMKYFCPEVEVPEFPTDITLLSEWFVEIYKKYFYCDSVTKEDLQKTEMYQKEHQRRRMQAESSSFTEYLSKLKIVIDIHRMREDEIERVSQLCMKTNQFNLTTHRYTEIDIRNMAEEEDYDIFSVHTADKLGDNGLVAVLICCHKGRTVEIDTFLMSCRVMGRKIEDVILWKMIEFYRQSYDALVGIYLETQKNQSVKDLYRNLGFQSVDNQRFKYLLKSDIETKEFPYLKTVTFSAE